MDKTARTAAKIAMSSYFNIMGLTIGKCIMRQLFNSKVIMLVLLLCTLLVNNDQVNKTMGWNNQ